MVKPSFDEAATHLLIQQLRAEQERLQAKIDGLTALIDANRREREQPLRPADQ